MLAPFDTLAYARRLRAAGVPQDQADVLAEVNDNLAYLGENQF